MERNRVEADFSKALSSRMQMAGFSSANATVQAAMASVLEDIFSFLLKTDRLHLFGSYSDGWGSCLTQLDGKVESSSDLDITIVLGPWHLHPQQNGVESSVTVCPRAQLHQGNHRNRAYTDGHVACHIKATSPNISIERSNLMPAIDLILALPCCSYPRIQMLQPGYQTKMSAGIMAALQVELKSPRCHVVAASPPGLECSRMRVSTTLLERTVMHNLTTIQGQFFVIIKYLIKKVISSRVTGLKTYIAKNLLFYMLDVTPEEDWKPEHLLTLVRESLQILVAMMESLDSDDVCMIHFFLRDANVYLKGDHEPKQMIVEVVNEVTEELPSLLSQFEQTLAIKENNVVYFHSFIYIVFIAEFVTSVDEAICSKAFDLVWDTSAIILNDLADDVEPEKQLESLMVEVNKIPDCVRICREYLKALAYLRVGKSLQDSAEEFQFLICKGVEVPKDTTGASQLSFTEAKETVLGMLQQLEVMKLDVSYGCIQGCMLEKECSGLVNLIKAYSEGRVLTGQTVLAFLVDSSPAIRTFLDKNEGLQLGALFAFILFFGYINTTISSIVSDPDAESPVGLLVKSTPRDGSAGSMVQDSLD